MLFFQSHLKMLALCLWITPIGVWGLYGMLGIEYQSAVCKTLILSLQPQSDFLKCMNDVLGLNSHLGLRARYQNSLNWPRYGVGVVPRKDLCIDVTNKTSYVWVWESPQYTKEILWSLNKQNNHNPGNRRGGSGLDQFAGTGPACSASPACSLP